ncbi:hypothetical protein A9Q84_16040 [Halobacteriovorax marinus]|uniref:MOSC domain-containing protein n=1 Tax=Halobacteriovorax marinus TaxID=97084 RepID=A0A1Y5F452_9BACT|nr:hypothetical protein A9Q84_16040 [Halobacteriovorax marinus]
MKVKNILTSKDSQYYSGKKKNGIVESAETVFNDFIECHKDKGLVGDRFYNYAKDYNGQVTFISHDLHLKFQDHMKKEIPLELYRRNIFVTGQNPLDFVGKIFRIGNVEFKGIEDCAPCIWMEKTIGEGALKWMKENHSGGLRAKVLNDGHLKVGDELNSPN